jgi:putative nucleotidyltransferase with HDIG domain
LITTKAQMTGGAAELEDVLSRARAADEKREWSDALAGYRSALDLAPRTAGALRADLHRRIGVIHYYLGDYDTATPAFQESEGLAARAGATAEQALAINCMAGLALATGRLDEAESLYLRAHPLAEATGSKRLAVTIDMNCGTLANIRGDSKAALAHYGSVIARYQDMNDDEGLAGVLNNAGMVHHHLRQNTEADECFGRALALAERRQDSELIGTILINRAALYFDSKKFAQSRECCDQAFSSFGRVQSRLGLGEVFKVYGSLYREAGNLPLAEAHLAVVARLAKDAGFHLLEAETEAELALLHFARGSNQDALRSLNHAHRMFTDSKAKRELVNIEQQLDRLESRYLQVVEIWGDSIEAQDEYTAGHCGRVAEYTVALAESTGFRGRDLHWMRMGAFLHDVGKTGVDPAILNKPGKLDANEWALMQRHTVIGDEIVADLGFPWDIRPLVRSHHERWNGSGYPDRLAGDEIPLTARILCVADVFDALTTTRSYRTAFTREEALRIMTQESGTVLDPELFNTFVGVLKERGEA